MKWIVCIPIFLVFSLSSRAIDPKTYLKEEYGVSEVADPGPGPRRLSEPQAQAITSNQKFKPLVSYMNESPFPVCQALVDEKGKHAITKPSYDLLHATKPPQTHTTGSPYFHSSNLKDMAIKAFYDMKKEVNKQKQMISRFKACLAKKNGEYSEVSQECSDIRWHLLTDLRLFVGAAREYSACASVNMSGPPGEKNYENIGVAKNLPDVVVPRNVPFTPLSQAEQAQMRKSWDGLAQVMAQQVEAEYQLNLNEWVDSKSKNNGLTRELADKGAFKIDKKIKWAQVETKLDEFQKTCETNYLEIVAAIPLVNSVSKPDFSEDELLKGLEINSENLDFLDKSLDGRILRVQNNNEVWDGDLFFLNLPVFEKQLEENPNLCGLATAAKEYDIAKNKGMDAIEIGFFVLPGLAQGVRTLVANSPRHFAKLFVRDKAKQTEILEKLPHWAFGAASRHALTGVAAASMPYYYVKGKTDYDFAEKGWLARVEDVKQLATRHYEKEPHEADENYNAAAGVRKEKYPLVSVDGIRKAEDERTTNLIISAVSGAFLTPTAVGFFRSAKEQEALWKGIKNAGKLYDRFKIP